MISINTMIMQLDGLRGTPDLTDWEQKFVSHIVESYREHKNTTLHFSGAQLEKVESIWEKHFLK